MSFTGDSPIHYKVPYITTTAAARAAEDIGVIKQHQPGVKRLQEYHAGIK